MKMEECCCEEAGRILDNFIKMRSRLFNCIQIFYPAKTVLIPDLVHIILDFSGIIRISHRSMIFLLYLN
jgi:hypothetical protein